MHDCRWRRAGRWGRERASASHVRAEQAKHIKNRADSTGLVVLRFFSHEQVNCGSAVCLRTTWAHFPLLVVGSSVGVCCLPLKRVQRRCCEIDVCSSDSYHSSITSSSSSHLCVCVCVHKSHHASVCQHLASPIRLAVNSPVNILN